MVVIRAVNRAEGASEEAAADRRWRNDLLWRLMKMVVGKGGKERQKDRQQNNILTHHDYN